MKALEFDAGVGCGEAPLDNVLGKVSVMHPGRCLGDERVGAGNAPTGLAACWNRGAISKASCSPVWCGRNARHRPDTRPSQPCG